jgi:hypothetical protein
MSDYVQQTDFSAKDALTTGDAEKIILGADFDVEFAGIVTAVASKYDSNDLASQANAEAESSNVVLMTPLRVANWSDYNAGMVGDIQALTDPNDDRILGWDDSEGAAIAYDLSTGLTTSGTNLLIDTAVVPQLGVANTFTASMTVSHATSPFVVVTDTTTPVSTFVQSTDSIGSVGTSTAHSLELFSNNTSRVAINSSGNFDFKGGTVTTNNASASEVGFKGLPSATDETPVLADAGKVILATGNVTIPANVSVAFPVGTVLTIVNNTVSTLTIAVTSDTLRWGGTGGTDGTRTLAAYQGIATLIKVSSTLWIIKGDLS